jgi:hypothetical protein
MTKQFPTNKFQHPNKNGAFGYLNFGFPCILYLGIWSFLLLLSPLASAQQNREPAEDSSPSQAQATMASLFGRGAKMPGIPRLGGTIALPSFDSSGMKIDESVVRKAED